MKTTEQAQSNEYNREWQRSKYMFYSILCDVDKERNGYYSFIKTLHRVATLLDDSMKPLQYSNIHQACEELYISENYLYTNKQKSHCNEHRQIMNKLKLYSKFANAIDKLNQRKNRIFIGNQQTLTNYIQWIMGKYWDEQSIVLTTIDQPNSSNINEWLHQFKTVLYYHTTIRMNHNTLIGIKLILQTFTNITKDVLLLNNNCVTIHRYLPKILNICLITMCEWKKQTGTQPNLIQLFDEILMLLGHLLTKYHLLYEYRVHKVTKLIEFQWSQCQTINMKQNLSKITLQRYADIFWLNLFKGDINGTQFAQNKVRQSVHFNRYNHQSIFNQSSKIMKILQLNKKSNRIKFARQAMINELQSINNENNHKILNILNHERTMMVVGNILAMKQCHWINCKKMNIKLKKCTKCLSVFYCSKKCQHLDWVCGRHSNLCVKSTKRDFGISMRESNIADVSRTVLLCTK